MSFHLFVISFVQSLFAEILEMWRDIKFQFTVKSMNDRSLPRTFFDRMNDIKLSLSNEASARENEIFMMI